MIDKILSTHSSKPMKSIFIICVKRGEIGVETIDTAQNVHFENCCTIAIRMEAISTNMVLGDVTMVKEVHPLPFAQTFQ